MQSATRLVSNDIAGRGGYALSNGSIELTFAWLRRRVFSCASGARLFLAGDRQR
jgi:hypothetical protein